MQRRRRLEEDRTLLESLRRRTDDINVMIEWAAAGEDVTADFARALDELLKIAHGLLSKSLAIAQN